MGVVWRAVHVALRSEVAIKLLHPAVMDSKDGLKRFLHEAQAAARLRSLHVVQILDHGIDQGVPYIAMELLEGESLSQCLARERRLSPARTVRILMHVARAISKAHDAGVIHRDLKPDNIFLVRTDDEEIAKVLDFGIAKMADCLGDAASRVSTNQGKMLGTPCYMSPEQVRGYDVDKRTDLWALAAIGFECLCGRVPFDQGTVGDVLVEICSGTIPVPSEVAPVPAGFDAWFAKGACRDPAGRFRSASEMAIALRELVAMAEGALDLALPIGSSGFGRRAELHSHRRDAETLDAKDIAPLKEAPAAQAASIPPSSGGPRGERPALKSAPEPPRDAGQPARNEPALDEPALNETIGRSALSRSTHPGKGRTGVLMLAFVALAVLLGIGWLTLSSRKQAGSGPAAAAAPTIKSDPLPMLNDASITVTPAGPAPTASAAPGPADSATKPAPLASPNGGEPRLPITKAPDQPRPKTNASPMTSSAPSARPAATKKDELGF